MVSEIVDSHQHFWQLDRFHYGWMSSEDKVLYKDFLPGPFGEILRENGVSRSVAVQAHQSIEEAQWLLSLADEHHFIAGVVGWVDLESENLEHDLAKLTEHSKFKGVRHLVQDEPDDKWLLRPAVIRGIKLLSQYGLAYDILVFPRHLDHVATFLELCPEGKFVIDHLAKPPIATGEISEWSKGIARLARFQNVYCKLSGMVTEADHSNWTLADLSPYAETVLDAFGPNRLMFGSDYPVCLLAASYERVLDTYRSFIENLSQAEQDRIMGGNAIDFYNL